MEYGVIGSRDFKGKVYDNLDYISEILSRYDDMDVLVSGGSKGVEALAKEWADENEVEFCLVPPNINFHGYRKAFVVRNTEIISRCDRMVIFWDGMTPGIMDTLGQSMLLGKPVDLMPMR